MARVGREEEEATTAEQEEGRGRNGVGRVEGSRVRLDGWEGALSGGLDRSSDVVGGGTRARTAQSLHPGSSRTARGLAEAEAEIGVATGPAAARVRYGRMVWYVCAEGKAKERKTKSRMTGLELLARTGGQGR